MTLPPASSTTSDGHGAPGRKLQGACLHLPTTGHTGGRQDQASWWHEQPQLLRVCTCHRQSNICRRGEGADASADEMKLEMEKEKKRQSIWTHDRSHLSWWWLPLSVAPPARQAQLHVAPARSTAQHCLLALLACQSLRSPLFPSTCRLPVYQSLPPFRLCRCLDGKLWVTTSSGCAGQRQAAIGCKCRGIGIGYSCEKE